jgi:Calcineurin-like phosphoesterase
MSFDLSKVIVTFLTLLFFHSSLSAELTKSDFVVNVTKNSKVILIAYGDMRFTDPSELIASQPAPRKSLVDSIAQENPSAIFLSGDVPWHGGVLNDYDVYKTETIAWQKNKIPVYPALGNHEFSQCEEPKFY